MHLSYTDFRLRTCKLHKHLQQWFFSVNKTKLRLYENHMSKVKVNSVHTMKVYGEVDVWVQAF